LVLLGPLYTKSPSQSCVSAGAKFSIPTARTQSESLGGSQLNDRYGLFNSSGSLAILAAIRCALFLVVSGPCF
jgi:hypothetical protein